MAFVGEATAAVLPEQVVAANELDEDGVPIGETGMGDFGLAFPGIGLP